MTPPLPGVRSLAALQRAVEDAWSSDTADSPEEWSASNPARGQCAVTAVVLRHFLGGVILVAEVEGGHVGEHHAWNRLSNGLELDLTRKQFKRGETIGPGVVSEPYVLAPDGTDRAHLLLRRVQERLATCQTEAPGHPHPDPITRVAQGHPDSP